MKKKMLLLGSLGAMLLSATLLIVPVNASVTSHCTDCVAVNGTVEIVSACKPVGIDGCACPLTGNIIFNNCFFVGSTAKR